MGTGSSFPRNEEFNLSDGPGVVTRIPIEMRPRMTLGGTLRSVGSLGRHPRGVSLRSTFSVELENTEVERVRKEFEMYRIGRKAEMKDALKRVHKLENENRRLRAELQALQKNCDKLRAQRDAASEAEHQARARASCFETERNKVQKQFKIFRESKEREIRDLLRTKEKIEKALHSVDPEALVEVKRSDGVDSTDGFRNLWESSVGSAPSMESSLHLPSLRQSLDWAEAAGGCLDAIRKDWHDLSSLTPAASPLISPVIKVYIAASPDLSHHLRSYLKVREIQLRKLCQAKDRFLSVVTSSYGRQVSDEAALRMQAIRKEEMEQSSLLIAVLSDETDRFLEEDIHSSFLNSGDKPAIFVFHGGSKSTLFGDVKDNRQYTVIDEEDMSLSQKLDQLMMEMERHIHKELGHTIPPVGDSASIQAGDWYMDDGGCSSGAFGEGDQQQVLTSLLQCPCGVKRDELSDGLDEYVSSVGPHPPLLLLGEPGAGKSHLLASWLADHAKRKPSRLVLYHFVGLPADRSSRVLSMVQRLTSQMLQMLSHPHCLTSDPTQLLEDFPRWLEKTSSRLPDGLVLVVDSGDRFSDCEENLSWLLDPIPVKSHVIISADSETCPQSWRSWPSLKIEPFSDAEFTDLIEKTRLQTGSSLTADIEQQLVSNRQGKENYPLYLTILIATLLPNIGLTDDYVAECLDCPDSEQLYRYIIQDFSKQDDGTSRILQKALGYIITSQSGLPEYILFELIPELTWDVWAPLLHQLERQQLLIRRSGLLVFAHHQGRCAVQSLLGHTGLLEESWESLIEYYMHMLRSNTVTRHLCNELPGLLHESASPLLLRECLSDVDVFRGLYSRGRCDDLLQFWQSLGIDPSAVTEEYLGIIKELEAAATTDVASPRVADLYEVLGRFSQDMGLLSQAFLAFQRSLEIFESIDPDLPSVGRSFYLIGNLHILWGKLNTAESYFRQALMNWELNAEICHAQWVRRTLDSLAALYKRQGKCDLMDSLLKKSAALKKMKSKTRMTQEDIRGEAERLQDRSQREEGISLAKTLGDLGMIYIGLEDSESAEQALTQCISILDTHLSVTSPELLQPLCTLASVYESENDLEQAEITYLRVLNITERMPHDDHSMVGKVTRNLEILHRKQGTLGEVEQSHLTSPSDKPAHQINATTKDAHPVEPP